MTTLTPQQPSTLETDLLAPVWTHLTHLQPVKAEGCYFYSEDGTKTLDFTCGIGVTNTGHCHPKIVSAIQEQASKLIFGQMNVVMPPKMIELSHKLNAVTPEHIDRFFFANSGAEAIEGAVKLARHATGKRNVIVMQGSFHGRTHQAMAMTTSKYAYRYNYQPLPGGVFVAPFPYSHYYGWDEDTTIDFCLQQLDLLLHSQTSPKETAAIAIEPILGEGGYVPAPNRFLQALRTLCDEHDILLIMDEVQSGFGRTGKFFAFEHANITPDVIVMAKGLGSGMPISAIAAPAELMSRWQPGTHGGTYGGGNAVVAAAACATVDVLLEEGLVDNAATMGTYLQEQLKQLQRQHPVLGDVRGRGLMVGVEFTRDGKPDAVTANAVLKTCLEHNLLLLICGSYQNVIRWIPPLIATKDHIDEAVGVFAGALEQHA